MNNFKPLFIHFQKSDIGNDDYLKEFKARIAMLGDYNANILDMIPSLLEHKVKEKYKDIKNESKKELKMAKENIRKKTSAALLLFDANHGSYDEMKMPQTDHGHGGEQLPHFNQQNNESAKYICRNKKME